jgi:hypothetical protein
VTGALSATNGYNGSVGATTPSTGAFTTLSATGNGTFSGNGATLTFSGTGSPTITATNSDLKITALAASADIIIDANRNQYQKINGSTIGLWASTGLAVTGEVAPSTLRFNRSGGAAWDSNGIRFQIDGTTYSKIGMNDGSNLRMSSGLVVDGNVGIGTTSPAIKLQISDVDQGTARIGVNNANGQNYHLVAGNPGASNSGFAIFDATASATRLRIDSSGLVGIGTTSPSYRLDVRAGTTATAVSFSSTNTTAYSGTSYNGGSARMFLSTSNATGAFNGIQFTTGANNEGFFGVVQESGGAGAFVFQGYTGAAYTERMRIDSSGNVGIGTASPDTTLDVEAANASFRVYGTGATDTPQFQLRNGSQIWQQIVDGADSNKWKLKTGAGTTVLNCDPSGGLAVTGALSSTGNFIAGTSSGVGGRVEANGGSNQNGVGAYTPTSANSCVAMWNAATSGDNVFVSFFTETSITARGTIDYNRAGNLVRYNTTSDENLKTNIRPLTNSGAVIDRLQPRIFDWKAEGHNTDNVGFIAQEVFEVFPDAVSKGSDTFLDSADYKQWSMDAGKFMPLVIAELQSLRARVAALESK